MQSLFGIAPVGLAGRSDTAKSEHKKCLVQISDLPVYDVPNDYTCYIEPPCGLEQRVSALRQKLNGLVDEYTPVYEKAFRIYETGRAHSKDESNVVARSSVIAVGGLTGLILARRRGFFRKLLYTSAGTAAVASLFYPQEAVVLGKAAALSVQKAGLISYHFVKGVGEPSEPKEPKKPSIPNWITKEGNYNGDAWERMSQMVSDVWLWGFRLFDRKPAEEPLEAEKETPKDADFETKNSASSNEPLAEIKKIVEEAAAGLAASAFTEMPSPAKDEIMIKDIEINQQKSKIEGDIGQASPEDKELYTTRA